ncbi:MAG: hypothetical protein KME42_26205 [Tildeniella nuda ZEHNDER 1965/U140]|jgi:hypothetical protein|nr:hypothetical protein [Tildeniella nuda ZEHNDER 1965/U140]
MSFNRSQAQIACELIFSCSNNEQFISKKDTFEAHVFSEKEIENILSGLKIDVFHLYVKGIHSLFEAILSIKNKYYSWAVIKLYYSNYYFLKSSLGINGHTVLRCKTLYLLKILKGESAVKKSGQRYKGDHKFVISIYEDIFSQTDILQSNQIDERNPSTWLMDKREQINYKELEFHDPVCTEIMQVVDDYVNRKKLHELLRLYFDDESYLYCFQPDHACLALPLKRASLTYEELSRAGLGTELAKEKRDLLLSIVRRIDKSKYLFTQLLA